MLWNGRRPASRSMHRNSWILALAAVLLASVGGLLLFGGDEGAEPGVGGGGGEGSAQTVTLAAPGSDATSAQTGTDRPDSTSATTRATAARSTSSSSGVGQGVRRSEVPSGDAEVAGREAVPLVPHRVEVRDAASGRAIEGVAVVFVGTSESRQVETDAEGVAELGWPEGVEAALHARHDGFVDLLRPQAVVETRTTLRMERSGRLVVRVDPPPTAETEGQLRAWLRRSTRRTDWLGAGGVWLDGAMCFEDLDPGEYGLMGRFDDRYLPFRAGIEVEGGVTTTLEVESLPCVAVEGAVRTTEGDPIPGAIVELRRSDPALPLDAERELRFETEADAEGSYQVAAVPPGDYRVTVTAPWGSDRRFDVGVGEEPLVRDFELAAAWQLGGVVVDMRGRPVAGAEVRCVRRDDGEALAALFRGQSAMEGVVTASDGSFQFDGLPARERLTLVATAEATSGAALFGRLEFDRKVTAAPSEPVEVVVDERESHEGRVLRAEDGEGLAGAEVALYVVRAKRRVEVDSSVTDQDGYYSIRLGPLETSILVANAEGRVAEEERIEVDDGAPVSGYTVLTLDAESEVRCLVVDVDGMAVADVQIGLELPGEASGSGEEDRAPRLLRTTDGQGSVVFDGLRPGRLEFFLPGRVFELVEEIPAAPRTPEDVEVRLVVRAEDRERPVTVVGSLVRGEDGGAVGEPRFEGLRGGVVRFEDERFEIGGVSPGRRRVVIKAEGRVPVDLGVQDLVPGATLDLGLVTMQPSVRLEVTVREQGGEPVVGADVRLRSLPESAGGAGADGPTLRAKAREGGRYVFERTLAGAWEFIVRRDDAPNHRRTIVVEPEPDSARCVLEVVL